MKDYSKEPGPTELQEAIARRRHWINYQRTVVVYMSTQSGGDQTHNTPRHLKHKPRIGNVPVK